MQARTIFAGILGAVLLVLPAAAQPGRDPAEEAARKAEFDKMAADPALSAQANADFLANNLKQPGVRRLPNGVQYKIIRNGFGEQPRANSRVEVYYTGKLINGKTFDGTSPGLPAYFTVADLIQGWSTALQQMRVGDRWTIWIPSSLAYGAKGFMNGLVPIPPNQTLQFELDLLAAKGPPQKGDRDYVPDASERQQQ